MSSPTFFRLAAHSFFVPKQVTGEIVSLLVLSLRIPTTFECKIEGPI